jgi:hypothetical protein
MTEFTSAAAVHVMHHHWVSLLQIRYAFAQNLNNSGIFVSERESGGQNCGIGMTAWRRVDHVEVRSAQTSAAHSEQYFARLGHGHGNIHELGVLAPLNYSVCFHGSLRRLPMACFGRCSAAT